MRPKPALARLAATLAPNLKPRPVAALHGSHPQHLPCPPSRPLLPSPPTPSRISHTSSALRVCVRRRRGCQHACSAPKPSSRHAPLHAQGQHTR
eukprot:358294-Chlamydomonas_euryale.AAC.1